MSIRTQVASALRKLFGFPEPKGGVVPDWRPHIIGHPFTLDPVALDHAKAVRLVGTVRACVLRKAMDMAAQPVVLEREVGSAWEPLKRAPGNIVDVWHAGNPRQAGREVVRDYHANFMVHGNAYMVAETFGFKVPGELWVMPSHLVRVIPGPRRTAAAYVFNRGGTEEAIPAKNVIAWHDFQPEDDPIGSSPLESVQIQYETRYDLMRLFQKVVRSGGVGAGYFRVPQPTNGLPVVLTQEEKEALSKQLLKMKQALDRPIILDMLQFDRAGMTMAELQTIENTNLTDADICRALGVPPWLIGIKEGAKLGDSGQSAQADERIYWMNLRTELEMRDAILTERLVPMFREDGVRFRTDLTAVPALAQPLLNSAQQIVALTGRPVLTVNEARRITGQVPLEDEGADELHMPAPPAPFGGDPAGGDEDQPDTKPAAEPEKKSRLIDTPERAERWRGQDALMRRYERKFEAAYVQLLHDRKAELLRRLESEGLRALPAKRVIDLDTIFAPDDDDERKIQMIYEALILERGADAAKQELALELELNIQTQTVQQFIKARKSVGLSGALETFMQSVRIDMAEGVGLNESLSEIAARVAKKFDEAEQGRVLTIARTETVSAYNFASVEAFRQSGDVDQLEWLSARDSAVRESHAEADGQVVGVTKSFTVGGASLEYPGDPSGPPEETINCRCVVLPVITERVRDRQWADFFPPSKNGHAKPVNRLAGVLK